MRLTIWNHLVKMLMNKSPPQAPLGSGFCIDPPFESSKIAERGGSVEESSDIHNATFVQTQFSTSHPKKQHFLKSWKFTFLWKYSVCGLKFEISEYPIKSPYVTYSPYKYELHRIKTHEIRAKYISWVFFFPHAL